MSKVSRIHCICLLMFISIAGVADAQDVINHFYVGGDVKAPVTIKTSQGTYTIRGGEVIYGNLSIREAYDAQGNKVVNTSAKKTHIGTNKPTERYYEFTDVYYNSSSSNSGKYSGDGTSIDSWDEANKTVKKGMSVPMDGYPNLSANVWWSLYMGEMITLQTDLGGVAGYYMQGGVGRNFFLKNPNKAISWMAEIGMYVGIYEHAGKLGVLFGRDQNHGGDLMLQAVLKYTYYLPMATRWGFTARGGVGVYIGDGFTWDVGLGVTYRFLAG